MNTTTNRVEPRVSKDESSALRTFSDDGQSSTSQEENDTIVARGENRAVFLIRLVVFGVLVLATVVVSVTVFLVTSEAEEREFKGQFESSAQKIVESFQNIADEKASAIGSLSIAYTSQVLNDDVHNFPFVSLKNLPEVGSNVLRLSGALQVIFAPRVDEPEAEAWTNYSLHNWDWMKSVYAYQNALPHDFGKYVLPPEAVIPLIWQFGENFGPIEPTKGKEYHLPAWEHVPVSPVAAVNLDLKVTENFEATQTVIDRGEIIIGSTYTYEPGNLTSSVTPAVTSSFLKSFKAGKSLWYNGEPFSLLFYPVFDSFDQANRVPVGVITAVLDWSQYFDRALPSTTPAIIVRLRDCKA